MNKLEKFKSMAFSNETHVKITLGLLVSFIVFLIVATWTLAVYVGDINNGIKDNTVLIVYNQDDIEDIRLNVEDNEDLIQLQEVKQAEINTKLANIENRQIEMIQMLRELK